jgi:hypothetical protein
VVHIELDAINWQSGWRDLTRHDPEEFVRRVAEAIARAWTLTFSNSEMGGRCRRAGDPDTGEHGLP